MTHTFPALLVSLLCCMATAPAQAAPAAWIEGTHYVTLHSAQHTSVPAGKIEVMEVFSYGCIYCNHFQPMIGKLKRSLPAKAQLVYLPAAFDPAEDWPTFQRAYFAAQALGIAERAHQAIYDSIWKTGELAILDPVTKGLKARQPSLEDVARRYGEITGVKPEAFLAAARSPAVDARIEAANAQIKAMQVPSTPCLVVNGKYRVIMESMGSDEDVIDVVKFLVSK